MKSNFKIIFLSISLCFTICTTLFASLAQTEIDNPLFMPINCDICNTTDGNEWYWETNGKTTTITCTTCGISYTYPSGMMA